MEQNKYYSNFKLHYQYREYHYELSQLNHSEPDKPTVDLARIHNSQNILGLILAFHISFAVSARKTAQILKQVFEVKLSYQTVLNYCASAAYYCHKFNLHYKGPVDDIQAGDETYIKIMGKHNYVFFFISSKTPKITAYHVADNRGTLPATIAMNEALRTTTKEQLSTLITDGNPAYPSGIHFLNHSKNNANPTAHHKVIGLQNLDSESEEYRPFKQLIERLNRTYKHHIRAACGFKDFNGALALTTLFVTHYNFLRPHMRLNFKTPVPFSPIDEVSTLQGKWCKLISIAQNIQPAAA